MENPKYHLMRCVFSALLTLLTLACFSQTASLTIDYDPVVCIENNDDKCRTFVNILVTPVNFCAGVELSHNSPLTTGENPSGIYFAGTYSFEVTARDTCGNELTETVAFEVVDCRPPTAICSYGLSMNLNNDCTAILNGEDLDANSEDNCSNQEDLKIELARVDNEGLLFERANSIVFEADDLGPQRLALIVIDETGNEAYCETVVMIECGDCQSACENQDTTAIIEGSFYTLQGYHMEDVDLFLGGFVPFSLGTFDSPFMYDLNRIDSSGGFGMLLNLLCAEKSDDLKNGVSTIDLVLMRRGILQLSTLNAYQNLAADVNGDQKVSTRDMLEIRQVILETVNAFSGVPSWMMFRSDFDIGALGPDVWRDPTSFDLDDAFC